MKKIFFSIFLMVFIAAACKKDRSVPIDNAKTQKVTFKVGFDQSSTGFLSATQINSLRTNALATNADTGLTNHFNQILYAIFNASGTLVHVITQKSTDALFGQYVDNLQPGTYTVAVTGGPENLKVIGTTLSNSSLGTGIDKVYMTSETFFSKSTITVGTTPSSHNISLHRISSHLIVNIKDPIPQGANLVSLTITGIGDNFAIGTETVTKQPTYLYVLADYPITPNGAPNYRISTPFMYYGPFTVEITVAKATAVAANIYNYVTIYGAKKITGVTGKQNAVTTLSGNMFGGNGTSGNEFQLSIDTAWKPPINTGF